MRYMLVIKTDSKEKALEIAGNISGFTLDESYAVQIKPGEYVVRGESAQKPQAPGVDVFGDGPKMQPMEQQSSNHDNGPRYAPIDGRVRNVGGSNRVWRSKGCP